MTIPSQRHTLTTKDLERQAAAVAAGDEERQFRRIRKRIHRLCVIALMAVLPFIVIYTQPLEKLVSWL